MMLASEKGMSLLLCWLVVEEGSDDRSIPLSVIPLANERTTLLGL